MRMVSPLLHVLLVDDDPSLLRTLKRGLLSSRPSWEVTAVACPKDGLLHVATGRFDVVVSDYEMPLMNGLEFLTAVEKLNPLAVRVIISGRLRTSVSGAGMSPIHAWLDKLRGIEELGSVIDDLVQRRRKPKRSASGA
jgi:two-component system, probable response regulator PhcQ